MTSHPPNIETDACKPIRVLHLEDDRLDHELVVSKLRDSGLQFEVHHVTNRLDYVHSLRSNTYDLILSDFTLPSYTGVEALSDHLKSMPDIPFVFVSGTIGEEKAVESLKLGATDYVLKSNMERLIPVVKRALTEAMEKARRIKTEHFLAQSEKNLRRLFEGAATGILSVDAQGNMIDFNPAFQEMVGYTPVEMDSKRVFDFIHEDDLPEHHHMIRELASGKPPSFRFECRLVHKNGTVAWVRASVSAMRGDKRSVEKYIYVIEDITVRKRAEASLRKQALLIDSASDAIFVMDPEFRVTYWNRSAELLYGYSFKDLSGKPVSDLFFENPDHCREADAVVREKGEWLGELTQKNKSGHCMHVAARWTGIQDQDRGLREILCIHTDISEKRRMQLQFFRMQRLECIGALAGGIAHDINNVMSPILMAVDLLRAEVSGSGTGDLLNTIYSCAKRGSELVKQILTFGKGFEGHKTSVQLKFILKDLKNLMQQTFPKNLQIVTRAPHDLWRVFGDPTQLHQVIMNLCVNARDAMSDGGRLSVCAENVEIDDYFVVSNRLGKPGAFVRIQVEDQGEGIPESIVGRIFDPFFTTKSPGKGTGLGLSTVLAIVKAHGGFLQVKSSPGTGSVFSLYFPAESVGGLEQSSEIKKNVPRGRGETVLVVDDENSLLQVTCQTLDAYGYKSIGATGGVDAVVQFTAHADHIQLVLMDIMMPVMDGIQAIQALRNIKSHIPIIAVSGEMDETRKRRLIDLKVDASVQKPYSSHELLMEIRGVLDLTRERSCK